MKRTITNMFAIGLTVTLAAFLLPTTIGYADDRVEDPTDPPRDALSNPTDDSGTDAPAGGSAEGELPAGDGQMPAGEEGSAATGVVDQLDPADGSGAMVEDPTAIQADAQSDQEAAELAAKDADPVQSYSGATMFETAVAEAKAAYPQGSETAIIVGPGDAWIDALSATGLAASKGPILFTERDSLHPATKQAFKDLGVKSIVIIGGTAAVTAKAEEAIKSAGVAIETRLGGANCFDTQMKIYNYGRDNGLWDTSTAIVATGSHYGDALSISPVAFAKKIPVFLVESGAGMRSAQMQALVQGARNGGFTSLVIVGGPAAVSTRVEGFVSGITQLNGGSYRRLSGATQYETSAEVANWAVSSQGFAWDGLAFTTGLSPYDALAGSVLQGGSQSVLLLVDSANTATLKAAAQHKASIDHVRFLGGTVAVPQKLRDSIVSTLGISTAARPKAADALEERIGEAASTSESAPSVEKEDAIPDASAGFEDANRADQEGSSAPETDEAKTLAPATGSVDPDAASEPEAPVASGEVVR